MLGASGRRKAFLSYLRPQRSSRKGDLIRTQQLPGRKWILFGVMAIVAIATGASILAKSHRKAELRTLSDGTARMAARLAEIRQVEKRDGAVLSEETAQGSWIRNRPESIPPLLQAIAGATKFSENVNLRLRLARELLWDGRNEETLRVSGEIRDIVERFQERRPPAEVASLLSTARDLAAVAFFRMAEAENCTCSRSGESCIFPIQGAGIHTKQRGSRAAIQLLTESLKDDPENLGARWLLNLATMTLGEHPAGVPEPWLLPPALFASERDIGRFENVAADRGVDMFGLAGGCILEDFDGDGDIDILASAWSLDEQIRFYRNRGDGRFDDRTLEAGLQGEVGGLNLSHADYDNDGHADVLIIRGAWLGEQGNHPCSLLRGNGDGTFEDVTEAAGLLAFHPGQTGAWGDFDNDGWLDLFMGREDDGNGRHPSALYRNNGDGTFTECAARCGLTNLGFVKGAAWGDFDNDLLPDLYLSRTGKPNLLFRNEGRAEGESSFGWKFRDVTDAARVGEPLHSFATWFFDFDNDGWLDIFAAGFKVCPPGDIAALYMGKPHSSDVPRLYRNLGNGTFSDVTRQARLDRAILTMGANFGDLDNDGFLDIYLGTGGPDLRLLLPNRMFRNAGGKTFEDVTTSGGFGHLQKGHGIAFGDIDADGDQDIYAVMGGWYTADGFRNCLFENPGHGNRWITLRLRGTRTNRLALGARIRISLAEPSGPRVVHAVVGTGGSFGSSSVQQEIGLGRAERIESIEVTWPVSGKRQVLANPGLDRVLEIREE